MGGGTITGILLGSRLDEEMHPLERMLHRGLFALALLKTIDRRVGGTHSLANQPIGIVVVLLVRQQNQAVCRRGFVQQRKRRQQRKTELAWGELLFLIQADQQDARCGAVTRLVQHQRLPEIAGKILAFEDALDLTVQRLVKAAAERRKAVALEYAHDQASCFQLVRSTEFAAVFHGSSRLVAAPCAALSLVRRWRYGSMLLLARV